ncbi:hypothetical protein LLG95_13735 [bacterium]|nr:hypothetical protein [bacterium]
MKSSIEYQQEDVDLLVVTMKFVIDEFKGPDLRKRLELLGYKIYPMDNIKMVVTKFVTQTGQANTSVRNEFVIQREYEIPNDFDKHVGEAKEHAEKYYQRVQNDLKKLGDVMPQYWKI